MIRYIIPPLVVPRIVAGYASHTFQMPRTGQARPGERIELVDNAARRQIIPPVLCTSVSRCEIIWSRNRIASVRNAGATVSKLDRFAHLFGYANLEEMEVDFARLFRPTYTEGFVIGWEPPAVAPALAVA